jgi:biopolymer transport protein TolR
MAFSTNGTGGSDGGNGLSSEINVTPLIDVLLVILIIFMVIVPVMPRGLGATLPSAGTRGRVDLASNVPVLVVVEGGGGGVRYRVDGEIVDGAGVGARLAEVLARRSQRLVLVKADGGLEFGVVSGVIDAGEAAGAEGVGLVTPGSEWLVE